MIDMKLSINSTKSFFLFREHFFFILELLLLDFWYSIGFYPRRKAKAWKKWKNFLLNLSNLHVVNKNDMLNFKVSKIYCDSYLDIILPKTIKHESLPVTPFLNHLNYLFYGNVKLFVWTNFVGWCSKIFYFPSYLTLGRNHLN